MVGSGTLITFPTLLAFGVPPVTANVSNTVGLVPSSLSGAVSYRAELVGQRARLQRLGPASLLGGTTGAALLRWLPPAAFENVVPVLIGLGVLLAGSVVGGQLGATVGRRLPSPVLRGAIVVVGLTALAAFLVD